ncbi:MAG: hypothetical protein HY907_01715 [Deltaproteobacteria bacterium]|nr:hypothetical protein [Deltaproteobacteria bacterium]
MTQRNRRRARWSDLVTVRTRYQRSVNLERDAGVAGALDGYVITPLVRTIVGRIGRGISAERGTRSWSLTGPYGSGKSAFAVFLADLFGLSDSDPTRAARALLERTDPTLAKDLKEAHVPLGRGHGLLPILAVGSRASIEQILISAMLRAAQAFWNRPGRPPALLGEITRAAMSAEAGRRPPPGALVSLIEKLAAEVTKSDRGVDGLLLLVDEAGKPLEHAAQTGGDVQVIQELAEAAARSGEIPIVFAVLLHQSFDQYAGHLAAVHRNEWAKVQGRFEDVAFQEAAEDTIRLIGSAIDRPAFPVGAEAAVGLLVDNVAHATAAGLGIDPRSLRRLLLAAAPLHPLTALLLGPLFRSRLAQNERSLFAFLAAAEPNGFQEFVQTASAKALYAPDRLYDYVLGAYGGRIYGQHAKQWAQVEAALRRLPVDADELDARLVKIIGLLGLIGDSSGLRASRGLLRAAVSDGDAIEPRRLDAALDRLRGASIVVFRKYRDAFQLWEGSDIDVDAAVAAGMKQVDPAASLAHRLAHLVPPRPLVARRHLFETGTLRYFDVVYDDESVINGNMGPPTGPADGVVRVVLGANDQVAAEVQRFLQTANVLTGKDPSRKPQVFVVPTHVDRVRGLAAEIAALEWVQTNTPDLHNDVVGRREVAGRIAEAERILRDEVAGLLGGRAQCRWFVDGEEVRIRSDRELSRYLSELCARKYSKAPTIHNELLNRRHLSSAAAAARRDLVEAMVTRRRDENLGIQGTPPEMSMYRSLLAEHGLHRMNDEHEWGFTGPVIRGSGSLRPVWDRLASALTDAREARVGIVEVFHHLQEPPYGLKDGVLPVLLVATILSREDEIALYEDGTFVAALTPATVERLLRAPEKFEIQLVPIEGSRASLYTRLARLLGNEDPAGKSALVPIVRQLLRVAHALPAYSRNTKRVSERAQAVREALLRAREPGVLLFRDLPAACGVQPFEARRPASEPQIDEFLGNLKGAIFELQQAYKGLLGSICRSLTEALGLPATTSAARAELAERCRRMLPLSVEPQLKSFLVRAADPAGTEDDWLVSLGTLLGGKPPESWSDQDADVMRLNLTVLRRRFSSVEALVVDGDGAAGGTAMLRLTVAQPGQPERTHVAVVRDDDRRLLGSFMERVRAEADQALASLPRETVLVGLGLLVQDLIDEVDSSHEAAVREERE